MKKIFNKITNGILLIIIGIMHLQFALSAKAFGTTFHEFSKSCFFRISKGLDELPFVQGVTNTETFATFWFFYFGIFLLVLGVLVHHVERKYMVLPLSFTLTYLLAVAIGAYMIPASGMTYIMLPHAFYMLAGNCLKSRKNIEKS